MNNDNIQNEQASDVDEFERIGLNYAVDISYTAIDRSGFSEEEKRNLLFSVYSFRCLFDSAEMKYINPILKKHGCTFSCKVSEHPNYKGNESDFEDLVALNSFTIPYGGLLVEENGEKVVRFDAGSPVFEKLKASGKITGLHGTIPQKHSLYDLVYQLITITDCPLQLQAMWYLMFPFVMLLGAEHEQALFDKISSVLFKDTVFSYCLNLIYSLHVADSLEELEEINTPRQITDWYRPYLKYRNKKDKHGVTNEVLRFYNWLSLGIAKEVITGSEKILNTYPDDENLLLVNIAAKITLDGKDSENEKEQELLKILHFIDDILTQPLQKKEMFLYNKGLVNLGLKQIDAATDNFIESLEVNPNFLSAKIMLNGIKAKLKGDDEPLN